MSISTPSIEGWSDDRQLVSNQSQVPRIVSDINGLHIIWTDDRNYSRELYYKKSIDNGKTWSSDKRLTNTPYHVEGSIQSSEMISWNNILHIAWADIRDGNREIYYKKSSDGGTNWSTDKRLTNTTSLTRYPSITGDSINLYIVFVDSPTDGYKLYVTTSSDNGNTWCEPYMLSTATVDTVNIPWKWVCTPKLISDSNGIHLFWNDDRNGIGNEQIYYKRSQDNGKTWTPDTNLTNSASDSRLPIVMSNNNGLHLFYADNKDITSSYESYYQRSEDGGITWTSPQRLTDVDGWGSFVSVGVSDNYGLHILLADYKYNGYSQIHYKRSTDGGNTWEVEQRLTYLRDSGTPRSVSVNGVLHLVWFDVDYTGEDHIFYKFYDPTPPTGKPTTPVVEYVSQGERMIKWVWTKGTVTDPESYFVKYKCQWERNGEIDDVPGEGGNGLTGSDLTFGSVYRIRVRARTETYRYTEWSDWSESVSMMSPLSNVIAYPNPVKPSAGHSVITFDKLSNDPATIKIYNVAGELVKILLKDNTTAKIDWNLKNDGGKRVASGVYIYFIENEFGNKKGKIAVVW